MTIDRTSGYDLLIQISEDEINDQLADRFFAGALFPPSLAVPFDTGNMMGTALLNFGTPVAHLDGPDRQMALVIPFDNSEIRLGDPGTAHLAPLAGTITIEHRITMVTEGSNQRAAMDFHVGTPRVGVALDVTSGTALASVPGAAKLPLARVEALLAHILSLELKRIRRIPFTPPIPVGDDADPTRIFDIEVIPTGGAGPTCLTFGLHMTRDTGGDINSVTQSFIPDSGNAVVMMSNVWLLAHMLRPRVARELGVDLSAFDTPLRLNRSIAIPDNDGILTHLEASVEGHRIRVGGRARDSGTGWSAVATFTFFVSIRLTEDGSIAVETTEPSVNIEADLAWWVWVASLGLGALFGGFVGSIVAGISLAVAEAAAGSIARNLGSGAIGDALGGLTTLPLGPVGEGFTLDEVILLDDLEFRGSIIRSHCIPVRDQGSHVSATGFTVNLDDGNVGSEAVPAMDLIWDPLRGISTGGAAGLTVTGTSFEGLTPVQIAGLPLSDRRIPLTMIPLHLHSPGQDLVFGVQTTDGRYARVRAGLTSGDQTVLHLQWVTFDTAVPQLDVAAGWSVLEQVEVNEYVAQDGSSCETSSIAWWGTFEAWPRLMVFPIDYQWCLCGRVLREGKGSVTVPGASLTYQLEGRHLQVESQVGHSIKCELCVSAIDARGQELFTCIRLSQPGVQTVCWKIAQIEEVRIELIEPRVQINHPRQLMKELADRS